MVPAGSSALSVWDSLGLAVLVSSVPLLKGWEEGDSELHFQLGYSAVVHSDHKRGPPPV